MGAVPWLGTLLFTAAAAIVGFLYYRRMLQNEALAYQQTLLTFTSTTDPSTGQMTPLTNASGTAQRSCSSGYHVNIVSAIYSVQDPYGECGSSESDVDPTMAYTCDPSVTGPSCQQDTDCSSDGSATCNNGTCSLQGGQTSCSASKTLTTISNTQYCIDPNLCGYNIAGVSPGTPFPNPYCKNGGNNLGGCAIRDSSAIIASQCDGRSECVPTNLGDYPCASFSPSACFTPGTNGPVWVSNGPRTGFCALPYAPGYSGGTPGYGGTSDPPSASLGYVLRGLYSCVANEE